MSIESVNGLELPAALVESLRDGRWSGGAITEEFARKLGCFLLVPELWSLSSIRAENDGWPGSQVVGYLGRKDAAVVPGDIDTHRSVLIASDFSRMFLALDYRSDPPTVVRLTANDLWVKVADTIGELIDTLHSVDTIEQIRAQRPDYKGPRMMSGIEPDGDSPLIAAVEWGSVTVDGIGEFKDVRLFPGGACEWDWTKFGTHHQPGVRENELSMLVERGAKVVVLGIGMHSRLGVTTNALQVLADAGVEVFVAETTEALAIYNNVASTSAVGALIHSTC